MEVTIIGGGVIGLCCAYYIRKEGHDVTVIDKNDITSGCSFGNMGYVSPSHFIPLASPGIIKQGLKWMLSSSSPFYIKPRFNLDLIGWGLRFWKSATARKVEENVPPMNELLQLSRHLMNDFKTQLPGSFDMIEKGIWCLYQTDKAGDHEKHLADLAEKLGLKTIICDARGVQSYEPEVELNVKGGVLWLDDCHLSTTKFMGILYEELRNMGVQFWLNTEVNGFETRNGKIAGIITDKMKMEVHELIIANGSWVGNISKLLGIKMPMQPGKGYSVSYEGLKKNLRYPSILVEARTATTPIDRWLRIGGTMELSGHNDKILPKRVHAIYEAFKKYYPTIDVPAPEPSNAWFGYRPVTPDGMPYIGRHNKYINLTYAGGHAMLGVSAAAGTGKLVNEILNGHPPSINLSAFNPERFS